MTINPDNTDQFLRINRRPRLKEATLLMGFDGWMDGGDVSTGTVSRIVELLDADTIGDVDPEPFYIFNFPGSMEFSALFRPHIRVEDGLVKSVKMPTSTFYCHEAANLALFVGKEPNLRWRTFAQCLFRFAKQIGVARILFAGSFSGAVPHTRQPRMYVTCSDPARLGSMEKYDVRRAAYEGPGSFMSYLMTQVEASGLTMTSLIAEIPGYLQGSNPVCIEAVTRRLAKILRLPLDLDSLRQASYDWEVEVTHALEENEEMRGQVRQLEEDYDNDLLAQNDV